MATQAFEFFAKDSLKLNIIKTLAYTNLLMLNATEPDAIRHLSVQGVWMLADNPLRRLHQTGAIF